MSLPNSNHTPDVNSTLVADEAVGTAEQNQTITQQGPAAASPANASSEDASSEDASQEDVQTLDSQIPVLSSAVSRSAVSQVSDADQSNVGTLDSRSVPASRPATSASADEVGETCLESPTNPDSLKADARSSVPVLAPTGQGPSESPRGAERYVLVENFAHGGLGNLWRAEDTAIRREVAFKELLPKALKNPVQVERFIEEAQISGQLEHPGIIPIYDVGFQENGTPYYAMKLVRGGNMEVAIEAMHKLPLGSPERQLAFNRLLRQFIAICQAVGFAHEKGVLHRDLKPLNVMLGEFGETLVLDWGLAKLIDVVGEPSISSDRSARMTPDGEPFADAAESDVGTILTNESGSHVAPSAVSLEVTQANSARSLASKSLGAAQGATRGAGGKTRNASNSTATGQRPVQTGMRSAGSQTLAGQVMGTPAYMSPEQAMGLIEELDARTDIYSLGAILYKLLTNQQPVGRGRVQEVLDKVIAGMIPPPRLLDPTIPKPLEAICLKAMARNMAARYSTALNLADDVENWLTDLPVTAYPDPWHEHLRRWAKQHRTLIVSSSATLLVLIGSILMAERAAANRLNRSRIEVSGKLADARVAINEADLDEAKSLLDAAQGIVDSEPKLVAERQQVETQLADLIRLKETAARERIAKIRNGAEREFIEAQIAIQEAQDFTRARLSLTRIADKLASEPALSELEQSARTQLKALDQFERFVKAVEQARFFGGNISGEESLDGIREAKRQAQIAAKCFEIDFDQPDKASSGLRSLGAIAVAQWRERMQEVLVTLAYLEPKLAPRDNEAEIRTAAQLSLKHLQQAERLGLSSQAMCYLRRDLHLMLDQQSEAQQAKQAAETLQPKTRLDFYLLGESARGEGRFADAITAYQDALRIDPDDFWSLNMLGLCNVQLGQREAAISSYTACIAQRPGFHWAYLARGVAFGQLKRFPAAHQDFAQALKLEPESYHAYLNRGVVSVLQQNYTAAQADFRKASQLKPDQAAPFINLARGHYDQAEQIRKTSNVVDADVRANAEYQQALIALTSATQRSPRQPGIAAFRGAIQRELGDLSAAQAAFERAIQLETIRPNRADHFKQLALIHARAGRWPEVIAAYDDSLKNNPDDLEVIRARAHAAMILNRYDEAVRGFTTFLGKAGPVAEVYQARAMALKKLGRHREAVNDYTLFLQIALPNEQAAQMLAWRGYAYLSEANRLGKADYEEAARLDPNNPNHFHGLARAQALLGEHAEAIATLERSNKLTRQVIEKFGAATWSFVYNPATVYALASGKVLLDPKLPLEQRQQTAQQYTQRAVELLREAYQLAGPQFQNILAESIRTDSELDPIRQAPEFQEVLKSIKANDK
ncbi:MAG: protein kinase domain-containing protein [Planctomycetaceae bacterium]